MKVSALRGHLGITLLALGAFLTLPLLAWHEYQWIGQTETAERARRASLLDDHLKAFAADFDRELRSAAVRLRIVYRSPAEASLPLLGYETAGSRLIKDVYYAELNGQSAIPLYRLKRELAAPVSVAWPAAWHEVRSRLLSEYDRRSEDRSGAWHFLPDWEALVQEVGDAPVRSKQRAPRLPRGLLIVSLDSTYVERHLLPELTRSHFGPEGFREYQVQVRFGNETLYESELHQRFVESRSIPLGRIEPAEGAKEDDALGYAQWELVVAPSRLTTSPMGRFRARSMILAGASLLILGAALTALFLSMRRAGRLARLQWEFVSGMSHELRTPVAALRSIAENMRDGVVGPGGTLRYGKLVALQAERLSAMVEDVLEFGRSRQRKARADQRANVQEAVDQAISAHSFGFEEEHFEIEKDVPANLPPVRCQASLLRQSIQNLLSNSLKYGIRGRWVRIAARDAGKGEVIISVEDRGGGIHRDELKNIFEPFFRGQDARASQTPGAGLGLSVVKRNMDAVGGRIQVQSQPGQGACFTLSVPSAGTNETANPDC